MLKRAAVILVLVVSLIGCPGPSNIDIGISILDEIPLNGTADPSSEELKPYGLNSSQFLMIKSAPSAGYQGWVIDDDDKLTLVWTGRSVNAFNRTANILGHIIYTEYDRNSFGSVYHADGGTAEGITYNLSFFRKSLLLHDDLLGYYIPAGTIMLDIKY